MNPMPADASERTIRVTLRAPLRRLTLYSRPLFKKMERPMKRIALLRRVGVASLIALVASLLCATNLSAQSLTVSETGRVLAGLPVAEDRLGDLAAAAERHRDRVDPWWQEYADTIGDPMGLWAATALDHTPGETIFYPFAGADFTTVARLYPSANRYVLVALQPAGRVPDLLASRTRGQEILTFFQTITQNFIRRGFFITQEMNDQFVRGDELVVDGITPVFLAMAEREGYEVLSVEPIELNDDGSDIQIHTGNHDVARTWRSVRIHMTRRSDGTPVIMDYLRLDLGDSNMRSSDADRAFIEAMSHHRVVLKAASHLLQYNSFSTLRTWILENAPSVLQDESGIEYTPLAEHFDVRLYGNFRRVNNVFDQSMQSSLTVAYGALADEDRIPLDFTYGYRKAAGTCLQYAVRP